MTVKHRVTQKSGLDDTLSQGRRTRSSHLFVQGDHKDMVKTSVKDLAGVSHHS